MGSLSSILGPRSRPAGPDSREKGNGGKLPLAPWVRLPLLSACLCLHSFRDRGCQVRVEENTYYVPGQKVIGRCVQNQEQQETETRAGRCFA